MQNTEEESKGIGPKRMPYEKIRMKLGGEDLKEIRAAFVKDLGKNE